MNLTVTETLNNQTMNETTGFLNQNWNLSMPLEVSPSLIISNATSDLTLYSNSTTNDTSVQFYVNFCVSDQQAGLAASATSGASSVASAGISGASSAAGAAISAV